jgi:leucyl aminopeptidase
MRFAQASFLAACVPAVAARFVEKSETNMVVLNPDEPTYLIETAPGKTQWVTEEQKWEIRRVSRRHSPFIDHSAAAFLDC